MAANKEEYETILKNVSLKLCQDGLVFDCVLSSIMCNLTARVSPPSDLTNTIDIIQKAMLYFGNVPDQIGTLSQVGTSSYMAHAM